MAAMDDVQPELLPPSFLTSVDKCSLKTMKMAEDSFWWARWAYSHRVYHNEGQGGGWVAAAIYDICANQISVKHTVNKWPCSLKHAVDTPSLTEHVHLWLDWLDTVKDLRPKQRQPLAESRCLLCFLHNMENISVSIVLCFIVTITVFKMKHVYHKYWRASTLRLLQLLSPREAPQQTC